MYYYSKRTDVHNIIIMCNNLGDDTEVSPHNKLPSNKEQPTSSKCTDIH